MNTPEAIVHLAAEATKIEQQPADAAALLVDAAALCASECGLKFKELADRLNRSLEAMERASQNVAIHGASAATKRQ